MQLSHSDIQAKVYQGHIFALKEKLAAVWSVSKLELRRKREKQVQTFPNNNHLYESK